jgi:predicted Na+-dependent transporter
MQRDATCNAMQRDATATKLSLQRGADRVSRGLRMFCVCGVLVLCAFVVANRYEQLRTDWKPIWIASLSLIAVAMAVGWAISLVMGLKRSESITFFIVFPIRNIAPATAIAVTFMGRLAYAAFATAYFLSEAFFLLWVVIFLRYRGSVPPTERGTDGPAGIQRC